VAKERLQKILAAAGLGSRRGCEKMIAEGRVQVNGVPAVLGMSADPFADKIRVDGTPLPARSQVRTFAVNKPRHVVSSLAAQGERRTVRDLLPFPGRFYPVGRLDMDSEGLMLLTNDGELAQRISHPSFEVEKEYSVLVAKRPDEKQFEAWRRGVVLADGFKTAPMTVKFESALGRGAWLRVVMHEGRKHELREVGGRIGLPVVRIIRRRIGNLTLGDLKPGACRELTPKEIESISNAPTSSQDRPAPKPRTFTRNKSFRPASKPGIFHREENYRPAAKGRSAAKPGNFRREKSFRPAATDRPGSKPGTFTGKKTYRPASNDRPASKPGTFTREKNYRPTVKGRSIAKPGTFTRKKTYRPAVSDRPGSKPETSTRKKTYRPAKKTFRKG
jgi:23S rRNA pseudouridine2605 synthase